MVYDLSLLNIMPFNAPLTHQMHSTPLHFSALNIFLSDFLAQERKDPHILQLIALVASDEPPLQILSHFLELIL